MYNKKLNDILNTILDLDQLNTFRYCIKEIEKNKINYSILNNNIVSIKHKHKPLFIAHLDTVNDYEYIDEYSFNDIINYKEIEHRGINLNIKNNKIYHKTYTEIIGGDDKCGVALILNNLKKFNFLLTTDEEKGCYGSSLLTENDDLFDIVNKYKIDTIINLDRQGNNDIVGLDRYYFPDDYSDYVKLESIKEILPNYKEEIGGISDLDNLCPYLNICGFNLSVGYYNPHSNLEYIDIKHLNYLNDKLKILNNYL